MIALIATKINVLQYFNLVNGFNESFTEKIVYYCPDFSYNLIFFVCFCIRYKSVVRYKLFKVCILRKEDKDVER